MNRQEENKIYTFEDWLNNELVGDYLVHDDSEFEPTANGIPLHRLLCNGKDQSLLLDRNLIEGAELNRIRTSQEKAYNILFKFYWSQRKGSIESARRTDKLPHYIKTRERHLSARIEKIGSEAPDLAEKYYKGYSFFHLMDPHLYSYIINTSEPSTHLKLPTEYPLPDEVERMRHSGYRDFIFSKRRELELSLLLKSYHHELSYLSEIEGSYPDPLEIAKAFKEERTKSRDRKYSIADIAFVMRYARNNPNIRVYADIIRLYEADPDCPEHIKGKKNTPTRWIKYYDKKAGIARKQS